MGLFSDEQLARAIEGVPFPARRWQLAAWADWNCAAAELREALRHIPDQVYDSPAALTAFFEAVDKRKRGGG